MNAPQWLQLADERLTHALGLCILGKVGQGGDTLFPYAVEGLHEAPGFICLTFGVRGWDSGCSSAQR